MLEYDWAGPGPESNGWCPGKMRTDTGGHVEMEAETGERVHRQDCRQPAGARTEALRRNQSC